MRVATISHPNEVIDKKVKYFYDEIQYLLSPNREFTIDPYENHLTLLEKILFRAQNDLLSHSSSLEVIKRHLQNFLFDTKTDFYARKGKVKKLLSPLKGVQKLADIDDNFTVHLEALIEELNDDEGLSGTTYFKKNLHEIVVRLECSCSLEKHKEEIKYFTNLLVAEFLRVGFSEEDFTKSSRILNRILSKKIHINDGNESDFYSEFPLPEYIEKFRGTNEFRERVEGFLDNRTFSQQFEGLYTIFCKQKKGRFLFKINNIWTKNENFHFTHNEVSLFTHDRLVVDKTTWEDYFVSKFDEFINEENTCLAETTLFYRSDARARQLAMLRIRGALDFLNYVERVENKPGNGGILETSTSFILFEQAVNGQWNRDVIELSSFPEVKETLYPKGFTFLPEETQRKFIQNDKVLFRISSTAFWDEQVSLYWRYIESFFSIDGEKIISYVSKILLLRELDIRRMKLGDTMSNILMNLATNHMLEPHSKIMAVVDRCFKGKEDHSVLKEYSTYPFFVDKCTEYENVESDIDFYAAKSFYQSLLWQTYEQRNAIFHQSIFCTLTIQKLREYLPSLVWRFRQILMEKLIDNPSLSIADAIDNLKDDAKRLLPEKDIVKKTT